MTSSLLQKDSDLRLIEEVARGQEAAFERLYVRHADKIFHFIYGFFFNVSTAEDVASDFWTTVWTHAHTFRGEASGKNWLYRIARNKALDELRRLKNKSRQVGEDNHEEMLSEVHDDSSKPDDELDQKRESERMHVAIRKLSEEHREVVELFYYQEMKYQEIEKILEIPLGTVKTRLLFAKKQLKRFLKDSNHCNGFLV